MHVDGHVYMHMRCLDIVMVVSLLLMFTHALVGCFDIVIVISLLLMFTHTLVGCDITSFSPSPPSHTPLLSISLPFFMHIATHVHGGGYMLMFDLFCSFTPYQTNSTPLYVASQNGHYDVVQSLLAAGADVNIVTSDVSDDL